jgi:thiamine pyrophosphate-dependent acetolactate synthase large subunit-like protein
MIRQTQDQWLESHYVASSPELGLHFPDYSMLAKSAGFTYLNLENQEDSTTLIQKFWAAKSPVLLRLGIDPSWRVIPQVKFGSPNEAMEPPLDDKLFSRLMLVPKARVGE